MKNEQTAAQGLGAWFDGRTVALIGTVFTVGIGVAGTNLASTSALRSDMNARFDGVNARFDGVNARFDGVNARIDGVNARIDGVDARVDGVDARVDATRIELGNRIEGLDSRLRGVEVGIAEMRGHLGLLGPVPAEPRTPPPPADAVRGAAQGSAPATPDAHGGGAEAAARKP